MEPSDQLPSEGVSAPTATEPAEIVVRFHWGAADVDALERAGPLKVGWQRRRKGLMTRVVILTVMSVGLIIYATLSRPAGPGLAGLIAKIAGAVAALAMIVSEAYCVVLLQRGARDRLRDVQETIVRFGADGITRSWSGMSNRYAWSSVFGLCETPDLLFVPTAAYEYVIVPKRALGDQTELERVRTLVQACSTSASAAFPVLPPHLRQAEGAGWADGVGHMRK